ncbi:hypothetical protein C8F04DRAFT_1140749, partial [Mycena alexandri]
ILYSLAFLCRRLHFIVLPIYLALHGLTPGSTSVVLPLQADRRDPLTALQTTFFTTPQTDNITCIFPPSRSMTLSTLLPQLKRLENYIYNLASVKKVTLQMDLPDSMFLSTGNDDALRHWSVGLECLLNCILERNSRSLTMMYGRQFTRTYSHVPSTTHRSSITRLLADFSRRLRSHDTETQDFRRVEEQGDSRIELSVPASLNSSAQLSALVIQSAILILPPALRWTLAVLQHCPITSLTLDLRVQLQDWAVWHTVISLIISAARGLTTLVLLEVNHIHDDHIIEFIPQFGLLRHLTIISQGVWELGLINPPPQLPELETIRASPMFIDYLLRHPRCFPKIKSICVVWPKLLRATANVDVLMGAVSRIIEVLDERELSPGLSVSASTMLYPAVLLAQNSLGSFPAFCGRIQALELTAKPLYFPDIADMAAWTALFPHVRRIYITLARLSITTSDFGPDVARLVRTIKATKLLE